METDKNYIFISYSRDDLTIVDSVVEKMRIGGYNVWYDADIQPGEHWLDNIASAIANCTVFLVFLSQTSLNSPYCQMEIHHAVALQKTVIPIYLEDVTLAGGLEMQLARFQAVWYTTPDELLETLQVNPDFEYCGGNIVDKSPVLLQNNVNAKTALQEVWERILRIFAILAFFVHNILCPLGLISLSFFILMVYGTKTPIWFLDKGGILDIISPPFLKVKMTDYNYSTQGTFNPPPWSAKTPLVECVVIRKGVTHIGVSSFQNCSNMQGAFISEGVTSIGTGAFFGCTALKEINLPYSLESLGWNAFKGCTGLKKIYNLGTVQEIPYGAFSGCTGLEQIDFYGLEKIGGSAFSGCTGLESIDFPSGITHIGYGAFSDCTKLQSIAFSTSGAYGIAHSAYSTQVKFSKGIQKIEGSAFANCIALKEVTIPNSIRLVGPDAFSGCSNLKAIHIQSDFDRVQIVNDEDWISFQLNNIESEFSGSDTLYIAATAFDPDTEIIFEPPILDVDISGSD